MLESSEQPPLVYREQVLTMMEAFGDIRAEVTKIRHLLEDEDDAEEEEGS